MPKLTESVEISQAELEEAVQDFLFKKYGKTNRHGDWSISFKHSKSTSGHGWGEVDHESFSARASRPVGS